MTPLDPPATAAEERAAKAMWSLWGLSGTTGTAKSWDKEGAQLQYMWRGYARVGLAASRPDSHELRLAADKLAALANIIERPPLDDVQLTQSLALDHAAAIRIVVAALAGPCVAVGDRKRMVDIIADAIHYYASGPGTAQQLASDAVDHILTPQTPPATATAA